MDGRRLKLLNIVDEYSRMCLAIRVGRRCKAVDVIDSIEELLNQYPAPTHLRMDNGPEFIAHALQEWCTGSGSGAEYIPPGSPWENPFVESYELRSTSSTTAGLGMNSCRRSRPEATYRAFLIVTGSKGIGRAAQDGVQYLQTAFGFPGAYAPGSPPAMEGGLTAPTSSHRNWTSKGGHVNAWKSHITLSR
jgi:transposase InsO family protein